MVETGTSASPPAAFSMPDLSSPTKTAYLVKKSSDDSSDALQKSQGTADTEDHQEISSPLTSSHTTPTPPILRSFKEATQSMDNSPASVKRQNSQEDSKKKEEVDKIMEEYAIIGTPPEEILVKY